jgi:hypothetical protein
MPSTPKPIPIGGDVLLDKVNAAITKAAVSEDLFNRVDSKLNGIFAKLRGLRTTVIVLGALVVANLSLTAAVILVLVAGHR